MTKPTPPQPNLMEYIDFRVFLKDLFNYRKSWHPTFSYRQLASKVGLSGPGFIADVLKGKKKLSEKLLLKLGAALQFNSRDAEYFENLVHFNQAKSMEEKNHCFQKLSEFHPSKAKRMALNQYRFYSKWYYSVVWNYVGMRGLESGNAAKIAEEIYPSLSAQEVRESLDLLLSLGLVKKMANGYRVTDKHVATEDPFQGLFARQFNRQMMQMAQKALDNVRAPSRQFNVLTFSISELGFSAIKERIKHFQEELRDIIERSKGDDRIYTLGLQLFPSTKNH